MVLKRATTLYLQTITKTRRPRNETKPKPRQQEALGNFRPREGKPRGLPPPCEESPTHPQRRTYKPTTGGQTETARHQQHKNRQPTSPAERGFLNRSSREGGRKEKEKDKERQRKTKKDKERQRQTKKDKGILRKTKGN